VAGQLACAQLSWKLLADAQNKQNAGCNRASRPCKDLGKVVHSEMRAELRTEVAAL